MHETLLLVQLAATWFMVGLVWFVQLLHYPLFARVGEDMFQRYEEMHTARAGVLIGPVMLAEAGTALLMPWFLPPGATALMAWVGLLLVAILWGSTFLVQVPLHQRLAGGFDPAAHRRLVATNWLRTVLWSARGILLLVIVARGIH